MAESLQLIGGLAYDRLNYPENFVTAPLSFREREEAQFSPKVGVIWTPWRDSVFRAGYSRSLGGASLDQSLQLEPSQIAGFLQSFRSVIPESVEGPNAGARFESYGVSWEQKFPTGTYVGVSGEVLGSSLRRRHGAFVFDPNSTNSAVPGTLREQLDYEERSLLVTLNQLLGAGWSLGVRYRLSHAELKDDFLDAHGATPTEGFQPKQRNESVLHQLRLSVLYNHPCGVFAEAQALWKAQSNQGYTPNRPGDDFWQFNLMAGYRFPRRRAEVSVGLLNLTGRDYRLNPLTLYNELPRERALVARLLLNF